MTSTLGQKLRDAIEAVEARKAISQWEQPTQTTMTTSISEIAFNMVRDTPGQTKANIVTLLEAQGHKSATVASLLSVMLRYGILRTENKTLFAVGDTYKSRVAFNRGLAKKRKVTNANPKKEARVVARPKLPVAANEFDVDSLVDSFTLRQALAVRNRINDMLAGVQG